MHFIPKSGKCAHKRHLASLILKMRHFVKSSKTLFVLQQYIEYKYLQASYLVVSVLYFD